MGMVTAMGVSVVILFVLAGAMCAYGADPARKTTDVKSMGATGDGRTLDGPAIQKAIDAVAEAGGGTVLVPEGRYVCGAIRLRSKVTLRLEKGAVLQASEDRALFPPVKSRWEGGEASYESPLLVAEECQDVAVVGAGTISGTVRTALVRDGRGIRFDGITFISNRFWTLHLLYCDGVVVENCRFTTSGVNTDGIDPDSTRNLVIRKCYFSTGDDCIAIKSGVNAEGVRVGRPSENILIEDCVMEKGHGAVSLGSEMSGGVRNVTITRCDMSGCWSGVRIKTRRGRGGYVENVTTTDCRINRMTQAALVIDTAYQYTPGKGAIPGPEGIPVLRNFSYANITGEGNKSAISMVGMKEKPAEGINLKNVKLSGSPAGRMENLAGVTAENLVLDGELRQVNVHGIGLPTARPADKGDANATGPAR